MVLCTGFHSFVPPTTPMLHIKAYTFSYGIYISIKFASLNGGPPSFFVLRKKRDRAFVKNRHIIRGEIVAEFIFDFIIETVFEGAIGGFWNDGSPKEKAQAIFTGACAIIVISLCVVGLVLTIRAKAVFPSICFALVIVLLVFVFGIVIHHLVKANKKK